VLRGGFDVLGVAAERLGHRPRSEAHAGHASRLENASLIGRQAPKLSGDHFQQVVGHREIHAVRRHTPYPATVRVCELAASDQLLDDRHDKQRIAVGALVNQRGQVLDLVTESSTEVFANVGGGKVVESELDTAPVRPKGLLDCADGVLVGAGLGGTVRSDDEQPSGVPPLRQKRQEVGGGVVAPVQVFENEDDRRMGGQGLQKSSNLAEHAFGRRGHHRALEPS
jgi:hypothetical protein